MAPSTPTAGAERVGERRSRFSPLDGRNMATDWVPSKRVYRGSSPQNLYVLNAGNNGDSQIRRKRERGERKRRPGRVSAFPRMVCTGAGPGRSLPTTRALPGEARKDSAVEQLWNCTVCWTSRGRSHPLSWTRGLSHGGIAETGESSNARVSLPHFVFRKLLFL